MGNRKIVVVAITNGGLEFEGIYSNVNDAETIAAANADKGDVILMSFEQTINDEINEERGVFNSNPLMRIFEEKQSGKYLS